jgi:hypothetical protein
MGEQTDIEVPNYLREKIEKLLRSMEKYSFDISDPCLANYTLSYKLIDLQCKGTNI